MRTSRLRSGALVVGAVLGCLCVLVAVAGLAFGVTPLVFRSGSMSPEIPAGSLAVARSTPGDDLRVGDVVSVENAEGTRITHRVVAVQDAGDQVALRLKGDANGAADPERYDVREADRVVWHVPGLGYAVAWTSGPVAVFLGGLLCGVLLMVAFGPGSRPPTRRGTRRASRGEDTPSAERQDATAVRSARRRTVGIGAAAVALAVAAAAAVPGTLAAFNDSATATGGAIASTAMTTPTAPTAAQTTGTGKVALGWAAAPLADGTTAAGYRVLRYDAATGGTPATVCTTTTDRTCSIDPSSSQVWYAVQSTYGTAWESTVSPRTSLTADVVAPTIAFTRPRNGESLLLSALLAGIGTACGGDSSTSPTGRVACGTTTDTSTPVTVQYQLQRRTTLTGANPGCWNGADAWVAGTCTSFRTAGQNTAGTSWWVPGARANAYLSGLTFTLTVRATDAYGNAATSSITYYTL